MADYSLSFPLFPERSIPDQEIPASAEEESYLQEILSSFPIPSDFQLPFVSKTFPLPPIFSPSPQEYVPDQEKPTNLIPMITVDDDYTYQDWPCPTLDQPEEQVFHHGLRDPVPFLHPSVSNVPPSAVSLVPESVFTIDGEADPSSRFSFRGQSRQGLLSPLVQRPLREDYFWDNRPPLSVYKLSVGMTQKSHEGITYLGLAAVIREHDGYIRKAITVSREDYENQREAEKFIYRLGITLCVHQHYRRLIAETEVPWLVEEYQGFKNFELFDYFEARLVSETDNVVASTLASRALPYCNFEWAAEQLEELFGSISPPI